MNPVSIHPVQWNPLFLTHILKRKKLSVSAQTSAVWLRELSLSRQHALIKLFQIKRNRIYQLYQTMDFPFKKTRGKTGFGRRYCQTCRRGDFSLSGLAKKPSSSFSLFSFFNSLLSSPLLSSPLLSSPLLSWNMSPHFLSFVPAWKINKAVFKGLLWGCTNPRWWSIYTHMLMYSCSHKHTEEKKK